MTKNQKNSVKTIEEWLESDDELPDACSEYPDTPSYVDDERFNKIRFGWIYNKELKVQCRNLKVQQENTKALEGKIETVCVPRKLCDDMPRKGILKKRDIYCLQSVENHLRGNVLLWFANFLMFKDMQSKYKLPRGCLVYENVYNEFKQHENNSKDKSVDLDSNKKVKYKIVVKK